MRYSLPLLFLASFSGAMNIISSGGAADGVVIASVTVNASLTGNGANPANALGLAPAVTASTLTVTGNAFSVGVSTLDVNGGNVGIGVLAAVTESTYTLKVSSGGYFASGGVQAQFFRLHDGTILGSGGAFTGGTVANQTTFQSTVTVQGNAFSVGKSTFIVTGDSVVINVPVYLSTYVYASNFIMLPSSVNATAGANFNIEWSTGAIGDFVMTANSSFTVTHPMPGQDIRFRICQNAIGGWAPRWGSGIDWGAAGNPTITTVANQCDYISMTCTPSGKVNAFLGSQGFSK